MFLAAGCAEPVETHHSELAHPGFWAPPPDVLARADRFDIENVQGGPWVGESGCSRVFLEGTETLQNWIYEHWPQVTNIGGYSCRQIANSSSMSVHGTGRALDIHFPIDSAQPRDDSADNDLGDPLANWLLEHAEEIGVQGIIWDNMSWYSSRPPGDRFRVYTNEHKHHDHIHMELNPEAAGLGTPWFNGPMGPPDLGPCGEPIGPEGAIIDDTDPCFTAYGPAEFWRVEDGGQGGSLKWTNAFESETPSNWARWNLEFVAAGRYTVEYFSVSEWAVYDSAQYRIRHDGDEDDVFVDLSAGDDGWQLLGEFDFVAGADQWVSLYDNAPVDVPADQHIIADAIRVVPVGGEPPPDVEPPGNNGGGPNPEPDNDGGRPPQVDNDGDGQPDHVDGRGGCGCATSTADPSALIGLLLLGLLRVRRRL